MVRIGLTAKMKKIFGLLVVLGFFALLLFLLYVVFFTETYPWFGNLFALFIVSPSIILAGLMLCADLDSERKYRFLDRFRNGEKAA